jgi:hypothetical protein
MTTPRKDHPPTTSESEQALRAMLYRATEDPDPSLAAWVQHRVVTSAESSPVIEGRSSGKVDFRARPRVLRALTIGATALVTAGVLIGGTVFLTNRRSNDVVIASTPTASEVGVRFDLDLMKTAPKDRINPASGPSLDLVTLKDGAAQQVTPGEGWSFLQGGQQRDNSAFLTATGPSAARLFDPTGGRLRLQFTSKKSLDQRTVSTGRNGRVYLQLTSNDAAAQGGDPGIADLLKVTLMIDPEIGPYLSISVAGVNASHALTDEQQRAFDSGRRVSIEVVWANGAARTSLNGTQLGELTFDPRSVKEATSVMAARLSIGASADYGAGFFSVFDDAIETISLESATES